MHLNVVCIFVLHKYSFIIFIVVLLLLYYCKRVQVLLNLKVSENMLFVSKEMNCMSACHHFCMYFLFDCVAFSQAIA